MGNLFRSAAVLASLACPAFGQQSPQAPEPAAAPAGEAAARAPGGAGTITIELNKLVPVENVCQAYFLVDNQTPESLDELRVDVYLFDREGVVLRGVALPFLDVRAGRTMVVPFELPDIPCGDIGRVLLNGVLVCTGPGGAEVEACAELLAVRTRADVAFDY
jgi:hypothetical protein